MAILGLLPQLATNNPILTVLPLSTVVFFTAMKDAIEDRNRHEIDKKFNSDTCYVLQNFYNVNYPREKLIPAWKKILYKLFFKSDKSQKRSINNNYDDDNTRQIDRVEQNNNDNEQQIDNDDNDRLEGVDEESPPSEPSIL
jgi:hypothetical protein